jgi:cytochrome c oxidase subunit 2
MIEHYIPQASSFAADIDQVILIITVIVGVWWLLTEGLLIGLVVAFRAKKGVKAQYITGYESHQKRWISIPHELVLICDIVVLVAAVRIWVNVKQDLPPADGTVRIIAQQWAWSFVHPGADGQLDTDDDIATADEVHVEVNKVYHFKLEARDVMHSFSVPAFRLKQDAIPGRVITGWFKPTLTGTFDIQCTEICGVGHALMPARIVVDSHAAHAAWLSGQKKNTYAALTAQ